MNSWMTLSFMNSSSPLMEQMIFFHDNLMFISTLIMVMIMLMMMKSMMNNLLSKNIKENNNMEMIWTILPSLLLIHIALPSIQLLYLMDETNLPAMTIKMIGHQWYWSYEYSDFNKIEFDSYIKPYSMNNFRLLEVDNSTTIPMKMQIRSLISSDDVIHAWTVPAMGVKTDAMPGRLNQINFMTKQPGVFFGQCSEICGTNHSFMPISVESISLKSFNKWIMNF
uniref:Cytochrome c oxidase subunit 2 n=1 Tax=Pseudoneureclipsis sibuyana TaxID=2904893 RepID=A0A9E8LPA1_9NEOP|nr:cytochrome c oxidase subunit II [Pseudoneureclipsis sibuyana]UZZ44288.1 cytochrome c oxidase subunit II [Pseudoneureclipsis sibuyana]